MKKQNKFAEELTLELIEQEIKKNYPKEKQEENIPIEVKSGKDYKRHIALDNLLSNSEYDIKKAYTLCNGNVEVVDNRIYILIYMIMFIKKKTIENNIINFDFSALKQKRINN